MSALSNMVGGVDLNSCPFKSLPEKLVGGSQEEGRLQVQDARNEVFHVYLFLMTMKIYLLPLFCTNSKILGLLIEE